MKRLIFGLMILCFSICFTGCIEKIPKTEKVRDLTFTVLAEKEIPEELRMQIEEKKEKPFCMSYEDSGILYIAEGYGVQPKTGYSVEVAEFYETENAVYFHSRLMGPEKGTDIEETKTFPYVVIASDLVGKNVVFD